MNITIKRIFKGDKYTIGKLYVNGIYECDTLEDTDRGLTEDSPLSEIQSKKVYGETAIPTGTYKIDMNTVSPKIGHGLNSVEENYPDLLMFLVIQESLFM